MAVEDTKEADLGPLDIEVCFVLGLQYVQNDTNSVFIVVSYDPLVCVCCVRLDNPTLFLTGLCRFVIFELYRLGIQNCWVVAEE